MTTTIGKRIEQLIEHDGQSVNQFAHSKGYRPDKFYNVIKSKSHPSWDMIELLLSSFPTVNGHWLLKGEGDMYPSLDMESTVEAADDRALEPVAGTETAVVSTSEVSLLRELLQEKERTIRLLEKQVALLENRGR